jgi:hypothetical protein
MKKSPLKQFKCCSICLCKAKNEAKLDGCSHTFCRKCIVKWSKSNNSCPECRSTFHTVTTAKSRTNIRPPRRSTQPRQSFVDAVRFFIRYIRDREFRDFLQVEYADEPNILPLYRFFERMLPLVRGDLLQVQEATEQLRLNIISLVQPAQ